MAEQNDNQITVKDLNTENPRWCAGCGDFGITMSVKKFMVAEQLIPHNTVNVSGIGCSGRASFYYDTYGVHAIHGRTIPIGLGLAIARPDLNLIIHAGDGDAMSIGGGHLMHGINKNFDCVFILYDNELYALTKNQTSPTTKKGHVTNTQPFGTYLDPIYPMKFVLGLDVSFGASTADWMPGHLTETLQAAHNHKGFSFVHIAQRCPHFDPNNYDNKSASWFSFLSHENGIAADKRWGEKTEVVQHDPSDKDAAFKFANSDRHYFGLFYKNDDKLRYDKLLRETTESCEQKDLSTLLDSFEI